MHDFFTYVIDVECDNHCGFRAVSGLVGNSVENYYIIRLELTTELNKNMAWYFDMFDSQKRFNEIKHPLKPFEINPAPEDKWMINDF
jgi:hypothetical protein